MLFVRYIYSLVKVSVMKKKSGAGRAKRRAQMKIARQFWAWVQMQETQDKLFGRRLSYFETTNKMRSILGLDPLTRADIPPGEDWDTIPPRLKGKERQAAIRRILSIPEPDEKEQEPSTDKAEVESAETPPPAQSGDASQK